MGFANVEPTISIVIPTYNCARFIERAVASVIQQKNCSYEILAIDCGSSDRTVEILTAYSQHLELVRLSPSAITAALNRGIAMAQGDLLTFLMAEDYFLPDKLASQAAIFVQRSDIGMVDSGWQCMGDNQHERLEICPWESLSEFNLEHWLARQFITPSTMMFRREWLRYVGGFDDRFRDAAVWNLVLKLTLKGCHATWLRQVTVGREPELLETTSSLQLANSLAAVVNNLFRQPDLPPLFKARENLIRDRHLVWIAWYLDFQGHRATAMEYLKKAWSYRSRSAVETLVSWIESFASFSEDWGIEFDANALTDSEEWQQLWHWAMKITNKTGSS